MISVTPSLVWTPPVDVGVQVEGEDFYPKLEKWVTRVTFPEGLNLSAAEAKAFLTSYFDYAVKQCCQQLSLFKGQRFWVVVYGDASPIKHPQLVNGIDPLILWVAPFLPLRDREAFQKDIMFQGALENSQGDKLATIIGVATPHSGEGARLARLQASLKIR